MFVYKIDPFLCLRLFVFFLNVFCTCVFGMIWKVLYVYNNLIQIIENKTYLQKKTVYFFLPADSYICLLYNSERCFFSSLQVTWTLHSPIYYAWFCLNGFVGHIPNMFYSEQIKMLHPIISIGFCCILQ